MKYTNVFNSILICVMISAAIISLRLVGSYPDGFAFLLNRLIDAAEGILEAFGLFGVIKVLSNTPKVVLVALFSIVEVIVAFVFFLLFKNSVNQSAMILMKRTGSTIKIGMRFYFAIFALAFVYIYSVVGIPVFVIIVALFHLISFVGKIPLSVFIGYCVGERLGIKRSSVIYFFLGNFIMMICCSIYSFGGAFMFFVFPVMSTGTAISYIINKKFHHTTFRPVFDDNNSTFDRDKIRNIIKRGIDN